jgi:hypothetical protein
LCQLSRFAEYTADQTATVASGTKLVEAIDEIRTQKELLVAIEVGVEQHIHLCPLGFDELLNDCWVDSHSPFLWASSA